MKLLDIAQFYSPLSGGVKRYVHGKARFLAGFPDHRHAMIVPSDRFAVRSIARSRVHELRCPPLPGSRSYRMLLSRRDIETVVAREGPDLVEVDNPYRAAWIALDIGRRAGIPVVAYYHSDFPRAVGSIHEESRGHPVRRRLGRCAEAYLRRLYGRMAATIVATERVAEVLRAIGIPRVATVPMGTDTEVFAPRDSRRDILRRHGIDPFARLLIYVGRLAREKNVLELIGMMNRLPIELRAHLLLVGDGELRRLIARAAAVRQDLTWVSYITDAGELAGYYAAADLLVHPGNSETFCLAAIEAQACGTRVVAVRDGGADHAVAGDTPPVLARSHRACDLAEAVAAALSLEEGPRERLARRRRIVEEYSSDNAYGRLFRLYEQVLAVAAPGTPEPVQPEVARAARRAALHNG